MFDPQDFETKLLETYLYFQTKHDEQIIKDSTSADNYMDAMCKLEKLVILWKKVTLKSASAYTLKNSLPEIEQIAGIANLLKRKAREEFNGKIILRNSQGIKEFYRGFEITVWKDNNIIGEKILTYTVVRASDGFFLLDSYTEGKDSLDDMIIYLRVDVDNYIADPDKWEEREYN